MKNNLTKLTLAFAMVAGASAHAAHDGTCDLVGSSDSARDLCAIVGHFREHQIGLHYGSLSNKAILVEVVRAPVTPEKLIALARNLKVEIESTSPGAVGGFLELTPSIETTGLRYDLAATWSHAFIADVRISLRDPSVADTVQLLVHQIFGREGFAVVLNDPR